MSSQKKTYNPKDWRVSADEYADIHKLIQTYTPQIATASIPNLENQIYLNLKDTISPAIANGFRKFVEMSIKAEKHKNNHYNENQNNSKIGAKNLFVYADLSNPSNSKILKHLKENNVSETKIEQSVFKFLSPIIKAVALSKKNRMGTEILRGFVDTYSFYFIHYLWRQNTSNTDKLEVLQFVKKLGFDKWSDPKDERKDDSELSEGARLIKDTIKDYYERLMGAFPTIPPMFLIQDDINQFAAFITNLNKYFNRNEDENKDNDQHWLSKMYPIQFDVCVIPRNTKLNPLKVMENTTDAQNENDSDDDDDDEKYIDQINNTAQSKGDVKEPCTDQDIGDITKKLQSHKINYYRAEISEKIEWTQKEINKHFANYVNGVNVRFYGRFSRNINPKFERYARYIILLDRRKETYDNHKKNVLYIYKAKDEKPIQSKEFDYFYQYQSFCLSKKCIIPNHANRKINGKYGRNCDIGATHGVQGYMFCHSYHLYNEDCTRIYLYADGWGLRYYQKDIALIWPKYFVKDELTNKEKQINIHLINRLPAFRDDAYVKFYEHFKIDKKIVMNEFVEDKFTKNYPKNRESTAGNEAQPRTLQEQMQIALDGAFPEELPGEILMEIIQEEEVM